MCFRHFQLIKDCGVNSEHGKGPQQAPTGGPKKGWGGEEWLNYPCLSCSHLVMVASGEQCSFRDSWVGRVSAPCSGSRPPHPDGSSASSSAGAPLSSTGMSPGETWRWSQPSDLKPNKHSEELNVNCSKLQSYSDSFNINKYSFQDSQFPVLLTSTTVEA